MCLVQITDRVQVEIFEYTQQVKILNLFQVVELEVRQQHDITILIEDTLFLSLAIDNILDPANMCQLLFQQFIFFLLIFLVSLLLNKFEFFSILGFVFFCDGEDGLDFKSVLEFYFIF